MSDGLTESMRSGRKYTYLNSIEIKKDDLFDQYKIYTKELIKKIDRLKYYSRSKHTFFSKTVDYNRFDYTIREIREIEIRIEELDKQIQLLDTEYKEVEKRELKSF